MAALGEVAELLRLGGREVGVVRRVTERHDHQMPGVVRVEIQHRVDVLAAGDDQALGVSALRDPAEGIDVAFGSACSHP